MWKWLIGALVVSALVCGVGGYVAYSSPAVRDWAASLRPKDKGVEVRVEPVARGSMVRSVNAPGLIEPKTKVQISAQVSARIVALPFREGDAVRKGDVVVRLDSVDLAALLESAQAQLRSEEARLEGARAAMRQAAADVARQRELFRSKDVSQAVLDAAESDYLRAQSTMDAATHAIEIARANIARAEKDLDNTVITAPMDGRITALNAEVGELVVIGTLNNAASVIMEIADLSVMLMTARVDETNITPVKPGQRAQVFINAHPGRSFEGVVERVGLKRLVDRDQTGYFEVEILVQKPDDELLRQGLNANTDIEVETMADVLMVPSQAVLDRRVDELPREIVSGSQWVDANKPFARVVYAMVEGKAVARPVSIGSSNLSHTVLLGGVDEGERVVVGPYRILASLKHDQLIQEQGTKVPGQPDGGASPAATASAK